MRFGPAAAAAGQISGVENRTFRTRRSAPPPLPAAARVAKFLMRRRKYGHFITGHTHKHAAHSAAGNDKEGLLVGRNKTRAPRNAVSLRFGHAAAHWGELR